MSTPANPFLRAHLDAQNAVASFLPSLSARPPQPAPPRPHPLAKRDIMQEMTHAASMVRHVEQASGKIALGQSPTPPSPPGPEQTFGNVLDVVHTQAIASAIASHPEEERSRLISEAHDSATKWIMSHNGKVVVHGKVMTADSPQSAEKLAARIINDEVEGHDQRKADEAEAANGENDLRNAGASEPPGRVLHRRGRSNPTRAAAGPANSNQSSESAVSGDQAGSGGDLAIGTADPDTGRTITHSTDDLDQAQDIATAAAPDLKDTLQAVADNVPGIRLHGVRPTKDKDRAARKTESDDKPVQTHSDLLAGRLVADSPQAKDAAVAALKSSMPIIDEEDSFQQGDPDYGFRSHDLQVALNGDKGPTSAEVQIVPKEVAEVDEETHPTYERGRDAEAQGDSETAEQAKAENREAHDEAMDKFNQRNNSNNSNDSGETDKSAKLRALLEQAGFEVTGNPVRIGGHSFLPIRDSGIESS